MDPLDPTRPDPTGPEHPLSRELSYQEDNTTPPDLDGLRQTARRRGQRTRTAIAGGGALAGLALVGTMAISSGLLGGGESSTSMSESAASPPAAASAERVEGPDSAADGTAPSALSAPTDVPTAAAAPQHGTDAPAGSLDALAQAPLVITVGDAEGAAVPLDTAAPMPGPPRLTPPYRPDESEAYRSDLQVLVSVTASTVHRGADLVAPDRKLLVDVPATAQGVPRLTLSAPGRDTVFFLRPMATGSAAYQLVAAYAMVGETGTLLYAAEPALPRQIDLPRVLATAPPGTAATSEPPPVRTTTDAHIVIENYRLLTHCGLDHLRVENRTYARADGGKGIPPQWGNPYHTGRLVLTGDRATFTAADGATVTFRRTASAPATPCL